MAVDQPNTIDIVAIHPDQPVVRLVIADHLSWEFEEEHLLALQTKLNAYLEFVACGQLSREYPESVGKSIQIEVAFMHEPTPNVTQHFLPAAAKVLQDVGLIFCWVVGLGAA